MPSVNDSTRLDSRPSCHPAEGGWKTDVNPPLRPLLSGGISTQASRPTCERRAHVRAHRRFLTQEQTCGSTTRVSCRRAATALRRHPIRCPTLRRESPVSAVGLKRGPRERRRDAPPASHPRSWGPPAPGGQRGWSGPGRPSRGSGARLSGRTSGKARAAVGTWEKLRGRRGEK